MTIELEAHDVEVLLESLRYSKQRVGDAQGTPYELRQKTLAHLSSVEEKLRAAKRKG